MSEERKFLDSLLQTIFVIFSFVGFSGMLFLLSGFAASSPLNSNGFDIGLILLLGAIFFGVGFIVAILSLFLRKLFFPESSLRIFYKPQKKQDPETKPQTTDTKSNIEIIPINRITSIGGFAYIKPVNNFPAYAKCSISKQQLSFESIVVQCQFCETYYQEKYLNIWLKDHKNCPVCQREIKIEIVGKYY
ncbi:MAG: hypothetical protein ACTSXA_01150 [Candidatus Heimdallarchaeota archaeon]